MSFKHSSELYDVQLERVDSPEGRYYTNEQGEKFDSVTHLLGIYGQKPGKGLENWKKRVGEGKALGIMKAAGRRGTQLHTIIENYLNNKENPAQGMMPLAKDMFYNMKPHLDRFDTVYGLEKMLFSRSLRMAGTVDCIAGIGDIKYVIDFKNARTKKREEWIHNYYLQATCYSIMLYEMYRFQAHKFMILIADREGGCQVFEKDPRDYVQDPFFQSVYNRN